MYCNPVRDKVFDLLSDGICKKPVKSPAALTLFSIMKESEKTGRSYEEECILLCGKYAYMGKSAVTLDFQSKPQSVNELKSIFDDYDYVGFLRFVVPDLVCDLELFFKAESIFKNQAESNYIFTEHILSTKYLRHYPNAHVSSNDASKDVMQSLFEQYCGLETNGNLLPAHNRLDWFSSVYAAVNLYPLDHGELNIRPAVP